MPVKRRAAKARVEGLSEVAIALLWDEPVPVETAEQRWEAFYLGCFDGRAAGVKPGLRDLWDLHSAAILAVWTREHPGTRPSPWWRWTAPRQPEWTLPECFWDGRLPLPRQRVGGVGTPRFEVLADVPSYRLGIPDNWVSQSDADYYNGRARDVDGRRVMDYQEGNFRGVPISASDPPRFEAQATYLERHGLLLRGEAKRLRPEDFEPEVVDVPKR